MALGIDISGTMQSYNAGFKYYCSAYVVAQFIKYSLCYSFN